MTIAELASLDYTYHMDEDTTNTEHWMFDAEVMALIDECDRFTKE